MFARRDEVKSRSPAQRCASWRCEAGPPTGPHANLSMVAKSGSKSSHVDGDDEDQLQRRCTAQIATLSHRLRFCATAKQPDPHNIINVIRPLRVEGAVQRTILLRTTTTRHRADDHPDSRRNLCATSRRPPEKQAWQVRCLLPGYALESREKTDDNSCR